MPLTNSSLILFFQEELKKTPGFQPRDFDKLPNGEFKHPQVRERFEFFKAGYKLGLSK